MTTLGNFEKEAEFLASKLLKQQVLPKEYQSICIFFSQLPESKLENLSKIMISLKKEMITKDSLVDESAAEKFYQGKLPKVEGLLREYLHGIVSKLHPLIKANSAVKQVQLNRMDSKISQLPDYSTIMQVVEQEPQVLPEQDTIKSHISEIQITSNTIADLLNLYGSGKSVRKKEKEVSTYDGLMELLNMLQSTAMDQNDFYLVGMRFKRMLDVLHQYIKPLNLDPYEKDLAMNVYDVFCNPKDFFTKCKRDEIISPIVGMEFHKCFPEFSSAFADIYLDDEKDMSEQDKINMTRSFGMPQDQTKLTTLCSQYVNMNFNAQGA